MNKKLVWLGCGEASYVPEKTQDFEHCYFFEARQEALNNISSKLLGSVELVNAAVSVRGDSNNLEIYSIEELSSLKMSTGLKKLFPGIVVEETRAVAGISLADCLSLCELSGQDNTLIVDLPCIVGEIIESLIQTRDIELFSCIYVSSGIEPLYEGAKTASELELLLNKGYFELNSTNTDDPDIPLLKFMYDERLANLGSVRAQLEIADEQVQELKRTVVELKAQLASKDSEIAHYNNYSIEYRTELSAKDRSLEESNQKVKELSSNNDTLKYSLEVASKSLKDNKDAFSALESDLEKVNLEARKCKSENEKLSTQLQESESKVDSYTLEVEALNSTNNSLKAKLEALNSETESLKSQLEMLNSETESLKSQLETLNRETELLKSQLETSNSVAESLNTKLVKSNSEIESLALQLGNSESEIEELNASLKASAEEVLQRNDSAEKDILRIQALEDALKKSRDKCDEVYSWFASRKKQVEVLESQLKSLKQERDNLLASLDTQKSVNKLEAKIDALFKTQSNESIEIANALGRHVTQSEANTCKELLALNKLQDVLHNKQLITYGSAQSLSSESLLFLTSIIRLNSYDVIIEFGSGTSTAVMADVVASKIKKTKTLHLDDDSKRSSEQDKFTEIESSSFRSLPNYIISFEQSETCLGNTSKLLENANLTQIVDLCLSPLIDNKYSSVEPILFYDCEEKLKEVKRIFDDRGTRILVIVDGPDAKNSSAKWRSVALPTVLDELARHKIDFFLTEDDVDSRQKLIDNWKNETERRGLSFNFEKLSASGETLLVNSRPM